MQLTESDYEKFKKISDEKGIAFESDFEMRQSANKLADLAELLVEASRERLSWDKRLEKEPKGFALASEGRTCYLCSENVYGEIWYDKWGMSCMNCHAAYVNHIIPGYVFKDRDHAKSITDSTLSRKFDIHPQTIMKLVRQGKLKARQVPHGPTVFLKRENPKLADILAEEKARLSTKKDSGR